MSNLQQPAKVFVSNRYSLQGQPSGNFENLLPLPIQGPVAFKVEAASVDYTWTTFSNYDNKLYIIVDGTDDHTLSLDTNKYYQTPADLASDLQVLFRSATSVDFIVAYNPGDLQRFRITPPSGTTFTFTAGDNSAYERLGFWNASASYSNASPLTGDHMPTLQRTHNIFIVSDLSNTSYSANNRTDIICRIPVTQNFGNTLNYQDTGNVWLPIDASYISTMRFQVIDDIGYQVDTNHVAIELAFQYPPNDE